MCLNRAGKIDAYAATPGRPNPDIQEVHFPGFLKPIQAHIPFQKRG